MFKTIIGILLMFGLSTNSNTITNPIPISVEVPLHVRHATIDYINSKLHSKADPKDTERLVDNIYYYSALNKIDPSLVVGLIKQESGFYTKAVSNAGAKGYMQVIPYWHKERLKGRDPFDKDVGVEVGVRVIRLFLDHSKGNMQAALKGYSGSADNYYNKVMFGAKELNNVISTYAKKDIEEFLPQVLSPKEQYAIAVKELDGVLDNTKKSISNFANSLVNEFTNGVDELSENQRKVKLRNKYLNKG